MNYILHQFRWTLRRRYREIIGLWLLWMGLLLMPHRAEHMEDMVLAHGLSLIGVIAVLGVLLDTLMDAPAMGTRQFWRTRPVTWGKMLVTQLLLVLFLLLPAVAVWGWQCWRLGAASDFLLGTLAILVMGLAGAVSVAAAASFAKGRAQFVWVVPLAVCLGYVWWVALLDHGLIALPLGFVVCCCIVAPGMERGKWMRRAGLGLLVIVGVYFARMEENWERTHVLDVQLTKLSQRTFEESGLSLRDEQHHLRATLSPSADYVAPTGVVVPVAEQISAVLPLPADIPSIKAKLNLPSETRWYEAASGLSHGELQIMMPSVPSVFKVISRERSPLRFGETTRSAGELTAYSAIRNDAEQLVISGEQWRAVWGDFTDAKYFLYSGKRSLVLPAREETKSSAWLPIWMERINTTLTISLPPGELLSGGPWRDDELSGLEIITVKSRPCLPPLPLEQTPAARAEQLQQLARAIEQFGPLAGFFPSRAYADDQPSFWKVYGKAGTNVLMQAIPVPYQFFYDSHGWQFSSYSDEELIAQASRSPEWLVAVGWIREKLQLGAVARRLLNSGAKPDIALLAYALQGVAESDYPLILQTLANVSTVESKRIYQKEPWRELVKLPGLNYQSSVGALWKRFGNSSPTPDFTFAAALSGEMEAMDLLVLSQSFNLSSYRVDISSHPKAPRASKDQWKPDDDLRHLLPEAPKPWQEFFKWYADHRAALTWDAAARVYRQADAS